MDTYTSSMTPEPSSLSQYLTAESTTIELKETLDIAKPKHWLKTISAFANTRGGTLIVGITDTKELVGVPSIHQTTAKIAELINACIQPSPRYQLTACRENNKDYLIIRIGDGPATPYYYTSSGTRIAYIRAGDQSIIAPPHILNSLILKGQNKTFDALPCPYTLSDTSFTLLEATYKNITHNTFIRDRDLHSFGLVLPDGQLTFAGALLCDQPLLPQSRIFCTRWKKLTKGNIGEDAQDDKEYQGNILTLLENAEAFIKNNSKNSWGIEGMLRTERNDYPNAAVREALINAIIHRDYQILGSEIHLDIYENRLEISSPGGMIDGSTIQSQNIMNVPSIRRNQIISDIFGRLHLMERRGSGLARIIQCYRNSRLQPEFYSDASVFKVTLPNCNYTSIPLLTTEYTIDLNQKTVLNLLASNPKMTGRQLSAHLHLSDRQIRRIITELKHAGLIQRIGSAKSGEWKITPPKE